MQYDEIRTVWCTRALVETVLKFPTLGDSTPTQNQQMSNGNEVRHTAQAGRTAADLE